MPLRVSDASQGLRVLSLQLVALFRGAKETVKGTKTLVHRFEGCIRLLIYSQHCLSTRT